VLRTQKPKHTRRRHSIACNKNTQSIHLWTSFFEITTNQTHRTLVLVLYGDSFWYATSSREGERTHASRQAARTPEKKTGGCLHAPTHAPTQRTVVRLRSLVHAQVNLKAMYGAVARVTSGTLDATAAATELEGLARELDAVADSAGAPVLSLEAATDVRRVLARASGAPRLRAPSSWTSRRRSPTPWRSTRCA
jgi:hypothetical protein